MIPDLANRLNLLALNLLTGNLLIGLTWIL